MMQNPRASHTSGEAARLCGLSLSTLKRWIQKGELRAYRTPGGDVRVLHAHLLDFMRKFGIPVHGLAPAAETLLVAAPQAELGARLAALARAGRPEIRVVTGADELEWGYLLAAERPEYVLLTAATPATAAALIRHIRRKSAPRPVRIGLCCPTLAGTPTEDVEATPEVYGCEAELESFVRLVLNADRPELIAEPLCREGAA